MALTLHFHPLSSYCQKALIALYENDTPFERHVLDLLDESVRARFKALWPLGKMPVLRDEAKDRTIPEATIIIEYLAALYPGKTELVPRDPELAWQTRLRDRFYDLYVSTPMQKIVLDKLRPEEKRDLYGVEEAKTALATAYGIIEQEMATKTWAVGEKFGMADCAAAPALYFANLVVPLGDTYKNAAAYLDRLMRRPSFARACEEAEPYRKMFPG
ncbi:MAG: glutathione S-transferase [Myxococcales bacterium 68-20]|nr:glutathione S-transferase family protein [Myxococcales bacterium]OJY26784.1 MAG: glutathione S-transferase [Myxococcales bacterium 68-20]